MAIPVAQAAQAEQRRAECCKKLELAAAEREELRRLERQAACRAQELSDSLLASHAQTKAYAPPGGQKQMHPSVAAWHLRAIERI